VDAYTRALLLALRCAIIAVLELDVPAVHRPAIMLLDEIEDALGLSRSREAGALTRVNRRTG